MSKYKDTLRSTFQLEGRFLGFGLNDDGEPKVLRLEALGVVVPIKLSKDVRYTLNPTFSPGDWIRVSGEQKIKPKTGQLKLKATQIATTSPHAAKPPTSAPPASVSPKACILVCQKSDCCKRGAKEVSQAIESTLEKQGLDDQVQVKKTGCLKNCKAGPNVIVMPDKTRYSRIQADEIPAVIEKHFSPQTNLEVQPLEPLTVR